MWALIGFKEKKSESYLHPSIPGAPAACLLLPIWSWDPPAPVHAWGHPPVAHPTLCPEPLLICFFSCLFGATSDNAQVSRLMLLWGDHMWCQSLNPSHLFARQCPTHRPLSLAFVLFLYYPEGKWRHQASCSNPLSLTSPPEAPTFLLWLFGSWHSSSALL